MKKLISILLIYLLCGCGCAETARDYALWLEEALPGSSFTDASVPDFVNEKLGMDYEFIARSDESYGSYIAGVRRADAPEPAESAHQSSYTGTFETRVFRAEDDDGKVYYDFVLADGVYMYAYDGLQHLIIWVDPDANSYSEFQKMYASFSSPQTQIFNAADSRLRAQLDYGISHGFAQQDESRSQLVFPIHSMESWQAGATREPAFFYLDVTPPADMLGERYLEEEDLIRYTRIPLGIQLQDDGKHYELVMHESGALGVETGEPHRLYEAGPGCDALLDLAEKVLGYRPGETDFIGKVSRGATLQWKGGYRDIAKEENLRRLDKLLSSADFSVGSVNCPSPCFLTVDYTDGSSASFAVAVNSFDLFFRNGMYFTAGNGELLDIFMMKAEEINVYE